MFVTADALGGLDVRLAFYRGFDEFKVSRWTSDGRACCPCCGDTYKVSNHRLEVRQCPEHGRHCEHWRAAWAVWPPIVEP